MATKFSCFFSAYTMDEKAKFFELFEVGITPEIIQKLKSDDLNQQLSAIKNLNELLNNGFVPSMDHLIETDIIPSLYKLLNNNNLYTEIMDILHKFTSLSDNHKKLINRISIPYIIEFLTSGSKENFAQYLKLLGNLADEDASYRDMMLDFGVLKPLRKLIVLRREVQIVVNATRLMYYICRGKPDYPDYEKVKSIYPVATTLLKRYNRQVLFYSCHTLTSLAEGATKTRNISVSEEPFESLLPLLTHKAVNIVEAALNALSKIIKTINRLKHSLKYVPLFLNNPNTSLQTIACSILSITPEDCKPEAYVNKILNMQIYKTVIAIVNIGHPRILHRAFHALWFGITRGNVVHIIVFVNLGCLSCLNNVLKLNDDLLIFLALECFEQIFRYLCKCTDCLEQVKQFDGFERIAELQNHPELKINQKANSIWGEYFSIK